MPNYIEEIESNGVVYHVRDRESKEKLDLLEGYILTINEDVRYNEPTIKSLRDKLVGHQTEIEAVNEQFEKYLNLFDAVLGGELTLTEGVHYGTTLPDDSTEWKPVIPYIGTDTEWKRCV